MKTADLKKKAVPYYACSIARILNEQATYTLPTLVAASYAKESSVASPRFRLQDQEVVADALKFLENVSILEYVTDEFGPDLILRHKNFSQNYDALLREEGTVFKKYVSAGERRLDWLNEALDRINELLSGSSDADSQTVEVGTEIEEEDRWEPLPISREDESYKAAIESAEKALEVIEQNNGYAATHPEERNGIVHTIRGTLDAIKNGTPSRTAIIEGLLKPFKFVAGKFSEGVMSEFAKVAVAAIIKWLF